MCCSGFQSTFFAKCIVFAETLLIPSIEILKYGADRYCDESLVTGNYQNIVLQMVTLQCHCLVVRLDHFVTQFTVPKRNSATLKDTAFYLEHHAHPRNQNSSIILVRASACSNFHQCSSHLKPPQPPDE